MATTETLGADEQRLAELGYKQELRRGWSSFSNFAISFSIISVLAGLLHHLRAGVQRRRPDRDLDRLADRQPVHPHRRLLDVRARLGDADRRGYLLLGVQARRPRLGLVHRLVQPHRARRRGGVGRLRRRVRSCPTLLGLYNVNFIFNFTSTNVHYFAHVVFAMFLIILIIHGLLNVFSSHLVSLFNAVSVWWHVVGVAVIVLLLIFVPSHHASLHYVFGHAAELQRVHPRSMFWFYVLPLGFLLTMYTITGYDASAHVSEETHGADDAAPRGVWRSRRLLGDRRLDPAARASPSPSRSRRSPRSPAAGYPAHRGGGDGPEHVGGQGGHPHLDHRPAVLRHGLRDQRLADDVRVLARRCGAGPQPVAAPRRQPHADLGRPVRRAVRRRSSPSRPTSRITSARRSPSSPSSRSRSSGCTSPTRSRSSCAGGWGMPSRPVRGRSAPEYKWVNLIAVDMGRDQRDRVLPAVRPRPACSGTRAFSWNFVNYAPFVTFGTMAVVTIWYFGWAKNTFKGPIRTIDDAIDRAGSGGRVAPAHDGRLTLPEQLAVIEPATEAVLAEVPRAGAGEVDEAVARARQALPAWRALAPGRARRPAARARRRARGAARGARRARGPQRRQGDRRRPRRDGMVVDTFRYYAGAPERLLGDTIPVARRPGVDGARAGRRGRARSPRGTSR